MTEQKANLILHPIRFQILTAISTYRMTTKEIADVMPDIPLTTLYRHINTLVEAGLLKVVDERPVRGTLERTYALTAPPSLTAEDLQDMSRQECEQVFTMFLSSLMSDAQRYLNSKPEQADFNPLEDGVHISKVQLFLDEDEYQQLNSTVQQLMLEAAQNQPRAGRSRRMFTYLFIPSGNDQPNSSSTDQAA